MKTLTFFEFWLPAMLVCSGVALFAVTELQAKPRIHIDPRIIHATF